MKANVADKTERLELGNIIELRGNFTEVQGEDGVSYECDYYRTTDKTTTFATLYQKEQAETAQRYLDSTDWVVAQLAEYQAMGKELPDRSEIFTKREEARKIIRASEK